MIEAMDWAVGDSWQTIVTLVRAQQNVGHRGWESARMYLSGRLTKSGKLTTRPRRKGGRR